MKKIRQLHFYLGVLFAPAIIFFSLTGAFQTFRLQEGTTAGSAQPLLYKLAAIHKDQSLGNGQPKRPPGAQGKPVEREKGPEGGEAGTQMRRPSPLPLKIFVVLMSLGLITSTGTGVYMAFKYNRDRRVIWGLLVAGTLLPIVLLYL